MIKVNLIGQEVKKDVGGYSQVLIGFAVIVALFVTIAALHIIQDKKLNGLNTRIAKAEKRIQELEAVKKKVDDFKARNAELNRRIQIIKVLEDNRTGPLYVMDALGNGIPKRAWIDEFTEKGLSATLTGVADNEFTVADFMEALQKSPYFTGVELGVIKKTSLRNQDLRSFVISSRLDYTGGNRGKNKEANNNADQSKKNGNQKVAKVMISAIQNLVSTINEQTTQVKVGVLLFLVVAISAGYWYFYWSPKSDDIRRAKVRVSQVEKQVSEYEAIARELPKFEAENKRLQKEFELVASKLPKEKEIPALIDSVYKDISASNLDSIVFAPKPQVTKEIYAEIPIEMQVVGTYYNLADFFDRISRLPRIVNVRNLNLERGDGGGRNLNATFNVVTFRLLPPPPPTQKGKNAK